MADNNDLFQPGSLPPWLTASDENEAESRQTTGHQNHAFDQHSHAAPVIASWGCLFHCKAQRVHGSSSGLFESALGLRSESGEGWS